MRRGLLAERLFHDAEALLAYRCCARAGGFNLVALTATMRLAAHAGDAQLVGGCWGWCAQPTQNVALNDTSRAGHLPTSRLWLEQAGLTRVCCLPRLDRTSSQALQAACAVLAWHESRHSAQLAAPRPRAMSWSGPVAVGCCVAHLVAQLGTDAVADMVGKMDADTINAATSPGKGKAGAGLPAVTPAVVTSVQQTLDNLLTITRSPNW